MTDRTHEEVMDSGRRRVVKTAVYSVAAIPLATLAGALTARAQESMPKLELDDPAAKALAYTHDASTVDPAEQPAMKEGANCANCQLYTGEPDAEWGPCSIFPGKLVAADGWCKTWIAKAG